MLIESFFAILFILQPVFAQTQPSVVWDEKTQSWISTPASPPAPNVQTVPSQPSTMQTQIQPQQTPTTYVQPTPPASSPVDLGTMMTVIGPMFAAFTAWLAKKQSDDKKDRARIENEAKENDAKIREDTLKEIKAAILPSMKHIVPVAEQTAQLDEKINQLAEAFYELLPDKANEIHDKPAIKKENLIKDTVKSKMIAEQAKNGTNGSIVWDDVKKEWISK